MMYFEVDEQIGTNIDAATDREITQISEANNIVVFSEGDNWIIDRRDDLAQQIINLIRKAKKKTPIHKHKGTYRMRAWVLPEDAEIDKSSSRPFGRQGP